jgi:signal transduction histidine kinase
LRRRLLVSTGLIALAAVLVLGLPLGVVGSRLLHQAVEQRLEREADQAAGRLARLAARGARIDAATVAALARPGQRLEVTLASGRRITAGAAIDGRSLRVHAGSSGALDVVVVAPAEERVEGTGGVWLAVVVLSLIAVATAIGLALVQARRLAAPLEALAMRAAAVGRSDADVDPQPTGVVEVDRVASALREAGVRIADLVRREREFSANASHQLRGPLTGLRMRLEELKELATTPASAREAAAALGQADRLHAAIEHLEAIAQARDAAAAETPDVSEIVDAHARHAWAGRFERAGRELDLDLALAVPAAIAPESVRQIVDVLLDNALRHGAGRVTVRLRRDADRVTLAVEDAGNGVASAAAERIFARRVSLRGGTGVGLALARDLARQAGGDLRLAGFRPTRFELTLPDRAA